MDTENANMNPLKIELFFPNKEYVKYMNGITNVNLFSNMGKEIDDDGLYSQRIFGVVGSDMRMTSWSFIDLNIELLHPRLFYYINKLGVLYSKILAGKAYAIFDKKEKNFILSDIQNGETGYFFFMKHIKELVFKDTGSKERADMYNVVYKYVKRGTITNDKLLILPAGLREFQIDNNGKLVEDEINDLYRAVFNSAVLLKNISNIEYADSFRYNLQLKVQAIYEHLLNLNTGKKAFVQGQWASRDVEFRSRTVITGTPTRITDLDDVDPDLIDICNIGLMQYVKAIDPITKYSITKYFIGNVFGENDPKARLYTTNFTPKSVEVPMKLRSTWTTNDGLDSVMNTLLDTSINNEAIMIGDYYLALIVDKGDAIDYYSDITQVPKEDMKFIRPITHGELFYVSVYEHILTLPGFMTRYPVTEQGSVVPVKVGVHTTSRHKEVKFTFKDYNKTIHIKNYPNQNEEWINGMSIPDCRLSGLGADYDGDQMSLMIAMIAESIEEINELFNTWKIYLKPGGESALDFNSKIVTNVMDFMTR